MRSIKALSAVVIVLLLCSCAGVKPPERPVAYVYPSVVPMSLLEELEGRASTADSVRLALQRNSLLGLLTSAGMQDVDLGILVQGLTRRGYAELDCRRSPSPLRWVNIAYYKSGGVTVTACFDDFPPANCRLGLDVNKTPSEDSVTRDLYGRMFEVKSWNMELPDGNFVLKRIAGRRSLHWETEVSTDK